MGFLEAKREREKDVVHLMISLYCAKRHRVGSGLCPACAGLSAYARQRVDACPRMEAKTFCSRCPSPCWHPDMREQIRAVMRFSGPRMLLYHPVMTARHFLLPLAEKLKKTAWPLRSHRLLCL